MKILVTGTDGFIGFQTANKFMTNGNEVVGIDSINNYYDKKLKYGRLKAAGITADTEYNVPCPSTKYENYIFIKLNLADKENIKQLFSQYRFDIVCHLAAQAGVRYSLQNPYPYIESNIEGFLTVLEGCRHNKVGHFVFASSSSVYGLNKKMPFATDQNIDHPVSLYAATKKSNELMAHSYSHLYGLPVTGLRFFTVYGPWGRPDMALFLFTKAMLEGKPISVFNNGNMERDFTYIDDIVEGVVRVAHRTPRSDPAWQAAEPVPSSSSAPYKLYNIGNGRPVKLMDFIAALEKALGKQAEKNMLPLQPGDVPVTWADTDPLERDIGYKPNTDIFTGVKAFVDWYCNYYQIK